LVRVFVHFVMVGEIIDLAVEQDAFFDLLGHLRHRFPADKICHQIAGEDFSLSE